MNYYRKNVDNTANDLKLKMQMAAFTLKLSENNNKIDDLLEVDKNIKKDISDNSNTIKNMKNEIDNYYDKNEIDLKFNYLYNKTYIDHKLDNIYDKTEINDKNSKLNRNVVLFNTNLTNHIDKYSNEKKIIDGNIKENKNNLNNFIINTFSNFITNISNLNNTQNLRLTDLEDSKLTETQSNKLEQLENIDLGNITKLDKFSYYIKEFFMHNIDLVRRFEITSEKDYIQILQFEIDRNFSVNDIIKFFISIKLLYENMSKVYWTLYFKMDVHYKDDVLIKSFKKQMTSKGFLFKNLATYNIDNMFKLNKDTDRLIFKLNMYKLSTAYKNHVTVTLTNSLEENYCNIIW